MTRFSKIAFTLAAVAGLVFPMVVLGDEYGLQAANQTARLPTTIIGGENTVPGIVGKVISIGLEFLGIVFFLLILYAGILWMTAAGNAEKTQKAKDIMEAAVIGLALVVAAYAIANFVFTTLTA